MDYDMLFLASPKDSSTKGLILRTLAATGELSLVDLQRTIKREFNRTLSYQAVRQAVLELCERDAVIKEGKLYLLNPLWVSELFDVSAALKRAVAKRKDIRIMNKDTTQVSLKSLGELGYFVLYSLEQKYFKLEDGGEIHLLLDHLWIPFVEYERRDRLKALFKRNPTLAAIGSGSLLDRILLPWYRGFGKVKLKVKSAMPCQYIVHGDTVVEIFMSDALRKKMDEVYKLKGILKFNIFEQLVEMTHGRNEIQLVITRNKQIAERVRNEIKKHL